MFDLELYVDADSFLHRAHPSVKILSILIFFLLLIIANSITELFILFIILCFLFFLARTFKILYKFRLLIILLFVMTVIMWLVITKNGRIIYSFGFISITEGGVVKGITAAFRLISMLLTGLILIATTRLEELAYGFEKLFRSFRFAFTLTMAMRLIPIFLTSIFRIIDAQTSRGHEIDTGGLFRRLKNYIPLLIPAFLSSIRNITQMSMALEVRGFSSNLKRTSYLNFKIGAIDCLILFFIFLLFLLILVLRILA